MKLKRIICLIISLLLLLSLAACGGQSAATPVDGKWHGKGGCYKLERLGDGDYMSMKGTPEHLVFEAFDHLSDRDGNTLFDGFVRDYVVVEDGVWYACEKGQVDGEYVRDCYVVKLGFDGQEISRFDISIRADSIAVASGTVYIFNSGEKELALYGTDGAELGKIDLGSAQLEEYSGKIYTAGDGSVWLRSNVQSGMMLYPVNRDTMSLGSVCDLPEDTVSLSTGTAEHLFLLSTQTELSYLDPATGSTENILYWDECDMHSDELSCFIPDGDGFLCLSVTGLSRLSPADPSEIHAKTQLTLGVTFPYDGSSELAAMFNAQSGDYDVEVIDYSNGGELSVEDAQMKLNTALMSGKGPDMVMLSDIGALQNASAFADMYPLLDTDPELKREDFYGLKAMETGGKLLLAPSRLGVSTFGARPEVVGNRLGWTWDEYFEIESKLPADGVMSGFLSAEFFLKSSLALYAPHAIDWINGTCSFDTPEFVRILEAAKKGYDPNCPEENPYFLDEVNSMMADGRMVLVDAGFSDAATFAQNKALFGELSYIGWPTPDGSCGSVFNVSGVSINAATQCMDGCWEFAKYVLKSTYAYKPTFKKAMTEATEPKDTGDGEPKAVLTEAQVEHYRSLMENITVAVSDGSTINDIVLKEAAAMFAGDKTPAETAKLIQSKISIYVSEHM